MPIRVFTDTGTAVGSDLLWTAPGEPATLLFDSTSGAKLYRVYVGSNSPVMHLPDAKAGAMLEVREGDGKSMDHLSDMLQAWNESKKVYGRALTTGIFEGGNRFGSQCSVFEHFQGWFDVTAAEHLELAPIAVDAAFVLVDGKEVVESPGNHGWTPGLEGKYQGAVDLPIGPHLLDYYYAYVGTPMRWPPLVCTLAVKGGSFGQWTTLVQNTGFFRPVGHDHVVSYELQPGSAPGTAPPLAIHVINQEESMISTDLPGVGLIAIQMTCLVPTTGTLTWAFDDGTTATGQSVKHLFLSPGMRTVHLSQIDGGKPVATLSQTISVHPDWANPGNGLKEPGEPALLPEHEADIKGRDPAALTALDLTSCIAILGNYKKADALLKLVPAVCAKMKEINETDLLYVQDAAFLLSDKDRAHYAEEIQLLRALIDRCGVDKASPQLISIGGKCRLKLAVLVLATSDHTEEVRSLLDAIPVPVLNGEEGRVFGFLRANLILATGDIEGARKQYQILTAELAGPDARSSIRQTASIDQARVFMDRKDFEAAEGALEDAALNSPIEVMSSDWALTRLRLYQAENMQLPAYIWAKRIMPLIKDEGRTEFLFRTTEIAYGQGDNDLGNKCLIELLKQHPYSPEAAQAKQKWPGKP